MTAAGLRRCECARKTGNMATDTCKVCGGKIGATWTRFDATPAGVGAPRRTQPEELEQRFAELADAGNMSPEAQAFCRELLDRVSRGTCSLCRCDQDAPLGHVDEVFVPEVRPSRGYDRQGKPKVLRVLSQNVYTPGFHPGKNGKRNNPMAHKYRYDQELSLWYDELAYFCAGDQLHALRGRVRLQITRHMGPRRQPYDHANMVGGAKPIVDAAKHVGIITDDKPALFEGHYYQERAQDEPGTTLRFSELLDPQGDLLP